LDMTHPNVLSLARDLHAVDRLGAFFDIIHQDPVLSRVKLIAEPWDLGEGGYQVGNFPVLWAASGWRGLNHHPKHPEADAVAG
jgi:glycogen operon protein